MPSFLAVASLRCCKLRNMQLLVYGYFNVLTTNTRSFTHGAAWQCSHTRIEASAGPVSTNQAAGKHARTHA
jgi:hypothetical protein